MGQNLKKRVFWENDQFGGEKGRNLEKVDFSGKLLILRENGSKSGKMLIFEKFADFKRVYFWEKLMINLAGNKVQIKKLIFGTLAGFCKLIFCVYICITISLS